MRLFGVVLTMLDSYKGDKQNIINSNAVKSILLIQVLQVILIV